MKWLEPYSIFDFCGFSTHWLWVTDWLIQWRYEAIVDSLFELFVRKNNVESFYDNANSTLHGDDRGHWVIHTSKALAQGLNHSLHTVWGHDLEFLQLDCICLFLCGPRRRAGHDNSFWLWHHYMIIVLFSIIRHQQPKIVISNDNVSRFLTLKNTVNICNAMSV